MLCKTPGEPFHYKGSLKDEEDSFSALMEGLNDELGNVKIATLTISDDNITIIGSFDLDKNNKPYSFDGDGDDDEPKGSTLTILDTSTSRRLMSKSGNLTMSKFKIHTTIQGGGIKSDLISYVLEFKGDFVVTLSGEEGDETYSATGKIVMSPYR